MKGIEGDLSTSYSGIPWGIQVIGDRNSQVDVRMLSPWEIFQVTAQCSDFPIKQTEDEVKIEITQFSSLDKN